MALACLDLTLPSPTENLACDEALLEERSAQDQSPEAPGVLRFWESSVPFVVLGLANKVAEEVHLENCREAGIPVLRRCSGGGTVLQGPGCLNYSLVLPVAEAASLVTITGTNRFILGRHVDALTSLLGQSVTLEGHTDLALAGRKFSGNAQRRKRDWLLFHGTFLLEWDLGLLLRTLRPPPRQPEYRRGRRHDEFLTLLPVSRQMLKSALVQTWQATSPAPVVPSERIATLVADRYSREGWNLCR